MTILIHRHANPATPPPPASPNATARTDHAALNKHPPPSVDPKRTSPQGPHVAAWQTHNSRHRSPPFRHRQTVHQPADNRSCQPIPTSRSRADPIRAQFGPADSRHCHASLTELDPDWTELDLTSFTSPRLSQPQTNALALRTHLSRHDKHPFFANFPRPHGPDAPPP